MRTRMDRPVCRPSRRARGFTLIELLVVLAIIGIIASIALVVASRISEGGRADQTRNIIKTLDQVMQQYAADKDSGKFPHTYTDDLTQPSEYPIVDGRLASAGFDRAVQPNPALPEPTTQLFLLGCGESESLLSAMNAIQGNFRDERVINPPAPALPLDRGPLVQLTTVDSPAFGTSVQKRTSAGSTAALAPKVRDPWGNQIRYVHPRYSGGHGNYFTQNSSGVWSSNTRSNLTIKVKRNGASAGTDTDFRRSFAPFDPSMPPAGAIQPVADADEGIAVGSRPYFYSPGPDRDPGTRDNNVYTEQPQFPEETRTAN